MSRSRKKTPVCGITTARSEKQDKRLANRRLRRGQKQAVERGDELLPLMREKSNVWSFAKDGRQMIDTSKPWSKKAMRK